MEEEELYLDKIRLGGLFVEKDLKVISQFTLFISDIRQGIIEPDDERLKNYPSWVWAWANIIEFYIMLKNGGFSSKITKEKLKAIEDIKAKYIGGEDLTIKDLKDAFNIVEDIMEITRFYDIVRKNDTQIGLTKTRKRYGLKNDEEN